MKRQIFKESPIDGRDLKTSFIFLHNANAPNCYPPCHPPSLAVLFSILAKVPICQYTFSSNDIPSPGPPFRRGRVKSWFQDPTGTHHLALKHK